MTRRRYLALLPFLPLAAGCILQGFFGTQTDPFFACGDPSYVCDLDGGHGVAVSAQDACLEISQAVAVACGTRAVALDGGGLLIARDDGGLTLWTCTSQQQVPCNLDPTPYGDAGTPSICADPFAACLQRFRSATTCEAALATTCGDSQCVFGCEDSPSF